jgi:error-prone DNA polymerase
LTAYVELHCHSGFSLLDGASQPEALAAQAARLEMPALALTDHDAVYGAPRFIRACREQGIRPLLGAELTIVEEPGQDITSHHLTLLVENETGWHNLCYLISRAQHAAEKGRAALPAAELLGCTDGLIALSGCHLGQVPAALARGDQAAALTAAKHWLALFGRDNFWLELQYHHRPGDAVLIHRLVELAGSLGVGCVATNNVHYAVQDEAQLQDVLVCIHHNTTLDAALSQGLLRGNSEYHLKSGREMAVHFAAYPETLANTLHLAERCHYELNYGLQDLPYLVTPGGMSSTAYLRRLCEQALPVRYPDSDDRARSQLAHELAVIDQAGLANYFLIVWDIVRFAREAGIRCQGRGSAANSLVAYLLAISPIDPLAHDLVFERFLSAERPVLPDIDLDFDAARREEVIQYLYHRYGEAHTAMACTFITFRGRSARRDVARVLGLSPAAVAQYETERGRPGETAVTPAGPLALLHELTEKLIGLPRHLGIHSGGMVITGRSLMGRVPTEPATMLDRVVVQWDKEGLEDVGLVKIDILGLRMLSAIDETLAWLDERGLIPAGFSDLTPIRFDDPAVYEIIAQADTLGIFQVESRAQAQMLPRLRPRDFNDVVVAISLIRPGPIQGNMVHPYLRRRQGLEPVTYAHPLLETALSDTLGVILFQEQVLKVARDLAGFSPGQGEQLRRALGSKRADEEIARFQSDFVRGAEGRGVPRAVAETVFGQLQAFGSYSFARSHAAAFAVLVYQSAWLKRYHFAPYFVALLNNQPMGFWTPAVLVGEARRRGVTVLAVDIQRSGPRCTVEEGAIRLGLNYVRGLRQEAVERIVTGRPFVDLADFCQQVRPGRLAAERLILAGAFDGWGIPRRQLMWELGTLGDREGELELNFTREPVALPDPTPTEITLLEQAALGLSTGDHLLAYYRPWLAEQGVWPTDRLVYGHNNRPVRTAGLVVVHQSPPTAKGMHFLTLEDETGLVDVVLRPDIYQRYARLLRQPGLLVVEGTLQKEGTVINVLARRLWCPEG